MKEYLVEYFLLGTNNHLISRQFARSPGEAISNTKREKGNIVIVRAKLA